MELRKECWQGQQEECHTLRESSSAAEKGEVVRMMKGDKNDDAGCHMWKRLPRLIPNRSPPWNVSLKEDVRDTEGLE